MALIISFFIFPHPWEKLNPTTVQVHIPSAHIIIFRLEYYFPDDVCNAPVYIMYTSFSDGIIFFVQNEMCLTYTYVIFKNHLLISDIDSSMQDVLYLITYVSYSFTFILILDIDPFMLEPTCTYLSLKKIYNSHRYIYSVHNIIFNIPLIYCS